MTFNNTIKLPQVGGKSLYRFNTGGTNLTDYAWQSANRPEYDNPGYGFRDWAKDAWSSFYQSVQQGEMNEEQDKMTVAKQNEQDLQQLLDYKKDYDILNGYDSQNTFEGFADERGEDGKTAREKINEGYEGAITRLRKNGVLSGDSNFVDSNEIEKLLQTNQENYKKAEENYLHNLDQYNDSVNKADVSQYFTKRSNDEVNYWGNFFYKMPATMGTSMTSPILQLTSLAGTVAGMKAGAAIGSFFGPWGTFIGGAAGLLFGAVSGQVAGGWQSRSNESHMEAFTGLTDQVRKKCAERGVDLNEIMGDFRRQLSTKGIDASNMDDNMVLQAVISTKGITSPNLKFNDVVNDMYHGSRIIYDKNNALGAGEIINDLTLATPLGKIQKGLGGIGGSISKATKGIYKGASHTAGNRIYGLLGKRFNMGADVARMGTVARNRARLSQAAAFLAARGTQMLEEGTEEGAQQLIQYEYANGEYDDMNAHSNTWQAIASGDVFKYHVENIGKRLNTLGIITGLNGHYKDDQAMYESVIGGMLLPFTDPRTMVRSGMDIANAHYQNKVSRLAGDIISQNLEKRDEIARGIQVLDMLDKNTIGVDVLSKIPGVRNFVNNSGRENYMAALERIQTMMKDHDKDGKLAIAPLNLGAITEDGSIPTDQEIDQYFDTQRWAFDDLWGSRTKLAKGLASSDIADEDKNKYIALRHQASSLYRDAAQDFNRSSKEVENKKKAILTDTGEGSLFTAFRAKAKAAGLDLTGQSNEQVASIFDLLQEYQNWRSSADSAALQLQLSQILFQNGQVDENAVNTAVSSLETANGFQKRAKKNITKYLDEIQQRQKQQSGEDATSAFNRKAYEDFFENAPNLDQEFADHYQYRSLQDLFAQRDQANARMSAYYTEMQEFDSFSDKAKERLSQYNESLRKEEQLAQQAIDDIQTGTESQVNPEVKNITDLTADQVKEKQTSLNESVKKDVDELNQILENVSQDDTNAVYDLIVKPILRGKSLIADDPIAFARFVSQTMRNLKSQYQNKLDEKNMSEAEKELMKKLKTIAETLGDKTDSLANLAVEEKAKARRHKLNLPTDSQKYRDADGNEYTLQNQNAQYSENEGVVLSLKQSNPENEKAAQERIDKLNEIKKDLENELKKRQDTLAEVQKEGDAKKIAAAKGNVTRAQNKLNKHNKSIEAEQQNLINASGQTITLTSEQLRKMDLKRTDNKGQEYSLNDKLKKYDRTAKDLISDNKAHRNLRAAKMHSEGDVEDSDNGLAKYQGQAKQIKGEEKTVAMPKAYPLATTYGAKQQRKLTNPYHQQQYWYGDITMPYDDPEEIRQHIKNDSTERRVKAAQTFHRIGKAFMSLNERGKQDEIDEILKNINALFAGDLKEIKIGNEKLTSADFKNMVRSLPTIMVLYSPRTGHQSTVLHCADMDSETAFGEASDAEKSERIDTVVNLLLSYRKPKKKKNQSDVYQDEGGVSEEHVEETAVNKVHINQGGVHVYFNGFSYNIVTQRDESDSIFQTESGQPMSEAQLRQHFADAGFNVASKLHGRLDYFKNALVALGFSKEEVDKLDEEIEVNDRKLTRLQYLCEGILKLGDGAISLHKTLFPSYIKKSIGLLASGIRTDEKSRERIAKKLLNLVAEAAPEEFLSHGDAQMKYNTTPDVAESVALNVKQGGFWQERSVHVFKDGVEIPRSISPENVQEITRMFQHFENLLAKAHDADEFLRTLEAEGYTFELGKKTDTAKELIEDYFYNRRFNRLQTPTNFVQALTMGTASPLNHAVNYDDMHKVSRHESTKITDVKPLHLIKGKDGKYYFSLDDWGKENIAQESPSDAKSEYEVENDAIKQRFKERKQKVDDVKDFTEFNDLIDAWQFGTAIAGPFLSEEEVSQFYEDYGTESQRLFSRDLGECKQRLKSFITEKEKVALEQHKDNYTEDKVQQTADEDDILKGKRTSPLTFAVGSFVDKNGESNILYYDSDGEKHVMQNAKGTAGAMYLVLPAYLNPQHHQVPIRLNVKHFSEDEARILAEFMMIAKDHMDEYLPEGGVKTSLGTITSTGTYRDVINQLVFTGSDAIENNPTANNFERLLTIEGGQVVYGVDEHVTDGSNIDGLVDFIKNKKTYRVDRQMAGNPNATFGFDLKIETNDGTVLVDRKKDQNYITGIVDEGVLTTDLDHSKIFGNPSVRAEINKKWSCNGVVTKSTTSNAQQAKKKVENLGESLTRESLKDAMEQSDAESQSTTGSSSATTTVDNSGLAKYSFKYVSDTLKKASRDLKAGTYYIAGWNPDTKNVTKTKVPFTISSNEDGSLGAVFESDDAKENAAVLVSGAVRNGWVKRRLVIVDEDGQIVKKNNGKLAIYGNGFADVKFQTGTATTTNTSNNGVTTQSATQTQGWVPRTMEEAAEYEALVRAKQEAFRTTVQSTPTTSSTTTTQTGTQTVSRKAPKIVREEAPTEAVSSKEAAASNLSEQAIQALNGLNITLEQLREYSDAELDNLYDYADGSNIFDDTIDELVEYAKNNRTSKEEVADGSVDLPEMSAGDLEGTALGAAVAQISAEVDSKKPVTKTKSAEKSKKEEEKKAVAPRLSEGIKTPTVDEIKAIVKSKKIKIDPKNPFGKEYDLLYKYFLAVYGKGMIAEIATKLAEMKQDGYRIMGLHAFLDDAIAANVGAVVEFFDERVEKEDYDHAISVAEKILGKHFDLQIDSTAPRVWDNSRKAQIYVFGQCTAAGIRLFRDANNRIARGALYHEAFHKVSLFILNTADRQKMYDEARAKYAELAEATNPEVEEFLADKFADYVLGEESKGKVGEKSVIKRTFKKLVDTLRKLINRLTKANLTPKYVNMEEMFANMYAGRYAYAKATKENREEFFKAYTDNTTYKGFAIHNVEIADNATQYQQIMRYVIAKYVKAAKIPETNTGFTQASLDDVYETLKREYHVALQWEAVFSVPTAKLSPKAKQVLAGMTDQQKIDTMFAAHQQVSTLGKIVSDENWPVYKEQVDRIMKKEFKLGKPSSDPNDQTQDLTDAENTVDNEDADESPVDQNYFSPIRDSYQRNLYSELDVKTRMILWAIVSDKNKFNVNGLQNYVNTKQLYRDIINACEGAEGVTDFIEKLSVAAKSRRNQGDDTLQDVVDILTSEKTTQAFKNKFFTDFARYTHHFENLAYEEKEHTDGSVSYNAAVKNSTTETLVDNLRVSVNSDVQSHFEENAAEFSDKDNLSLWKKLVDKMCTDISTGALTKAKIQEFISDLNSYFGINRISGDATKDVEILEKILTRNRRFFKPLNDFARSLSVSDFNTKTSGKSTGESPYATKVKRFLGIGTDLKNAPMAVLVNEMKEYLPTTAKSASQRGPENTKIYVEGSYNFVTRMFGSVMKSAKWVKKMLKNPYAKHSRWVKQIDAQGDTKRFRFNTKLATVLDDDFGNAISDIKTTRVENILNTFTECLSGKTNIPSLANKKFAGHVTGLAQFSSVVDSDGIINKDVLDAFTGYLADEILSVCDTIYARKNFINSLNNILGTNYTIESFSALDSLQQEALFNSNAEAANLLRNLVNVYHYDPKYSQVVINKDGHVAIRSFHINLAKSKGSEFRHFKNLGKKINADQNLEALAERISADMFTDDDRSAATKMAEDIAADYVDDLRKILYRNVGITINEMINNNIIAGEQSDADGNVNVESLQNKVLPENLITQKFKVSGVDGITLYRAIAFYTVQNMSDMVEFEKTVSGDIGYHKDITSVNKRYSGVVSTMDITAEQGCLRSEWDDDELYDSPTYKTLTLNTSAVVAKNKYEGDLRIALGIVPMDVDENGKYKYTVAGKSIAPALNHKLLLNADGSLKEEVKNSALGERFEKLRAEGLTKFLDAEGKPISDEELAKMLVADADNRFNGYLGINATDAQVYISARFYRQLRQRRGDWNIIDEARYNLMEHWDELPTYLKIPAYREKVIQALNVLAVDVDRFEKEAAAFEKAEKKNNKKGIEQYKGYILGITEGLDATSLKYVYYGDDEGRSDKLVTPIYDKMSLAPVFRLFCDGHEMQELRDVMDERGVDFVKFESAVKSGGIPSFEAFDENGHINQTSLKNAPAQSQFFARLGKQLNTDPHTDVETSLLTQFMKIAVENISPTDELTVGDKKMTGSEFLAAYKQILDELTQRGAKKFRHDYGISVKDGKTVLNRKVFMEKLKDMMSTQDLPLATLDALSLDENGNFKIHPAALPSIRAIQSRIISEMGKTIINTAIPGQPLYQMSSFGYDNIFSLNNHADKHLYMPGEIDDKGNIVKRMQVRLSINLFSDIIKKAKAATKAGELTGYDFSNFADQRRFILENKDLIAMSYRVPTQGQDSTIPIEIVDILPTQMGGVIQFPSGITAQTGSDFDIDKMYLARFNYTIDHGKLKKLKYKTDGIGNTNVRLNQSDAELQNMLLDMYQTVLTSKDHYIAVNTPLDVCTAPIKQTILEAPASDKHKYEGEDGYYLNPMFQTAQKIKNAGSDGGIAPMALNSVFRFFIQCAKLKMNFPRVMKEVGLDNMSRIFDRDGEDITDTTSALINAFVDAVKDNYIGDGNVNDFTFDVTSLLTSLGFGKGMFAFLMQPAIKEAADNYIAWKKGMVGVQPQLAQGKRYLEVVYTKYSSEDHVELQPKHLTLETLKQQMEHPTKEVQSAYLRFFEELKDFAQEYRRALTVAQVDTKKYGISADALIAFQQKVDYFTSDWNTSFQNPTALFDDTFLGQKYEDGVEGLFDALKDTIFEFSNKYKELLDELCLQGGVYGKYNDKYTKVVGPKIKTVFMSQFFNEWLFNRFNDVPKPLAALTFGERSVPARYKEIANRCYDMNVGKDFFDNVKFSYNDSVKLPQFATVKSAVKEDFAVKNNVQNAMLELFNCNDPEVRQWAEDFAVYMYYVSAGSDSNAGGSVKTTVYDILPPQSLGNITTNIGGEDYTFNEFVEQYMMDPNQKPEQILEQAQRLATITDDEFFPTLNLGSKKNWVTNVTKNGSVIIVNKSAKNLVRGDMKYGGMWTPFIQVRDKSNKVWTYKLIGVAKADLVDKGGRPYSMIKPVYGKTQSLGYVTPKQRNKSIRADGYLDNDGNTQSLIMNTTKDQANSFNDIDTMMTAEKAAMPKNVTNFFPVTENRFDFSNVYNSTDDAVWKDTSSFIPYILSDVCDSLMYIDGDSISSGNKKALGWGHTTGKSIHKVKSDSSDFYDGETVAVVSDFESTKLEEIIKNNQNVNFMVAIPNAVIETFGYPHIATYSNVTVISDNENGVTQAVPTTTEKQDSVFKTVSKYDRSLVSKDSKTLYVFTDNTDHTSKKGVPGSYGSDDNPTTAVIRGLPNAVGISTMKYFYPEHNLPTYKAAQWKDEDKAEFESTVKAEVDAAVKKFKEGNYEKVVLPGQGDGFFNSHLAEITEKRTPKLYQILTEQIDRLKQELEEVYKGKKTKEHCKS